MASRRQIISESRGIALCSQDSRGIVRLLMIRRRYTYAFFMFVCGKYNVHSDAEIIRLLDSMTIDEKIDILSLNFRQLWYRIWLGKIDQPMFINARLMFNDCLLRYGDARIKALIKRSRTNAELLWELPKGHKKYPSEYDLDCAIREFYEETGIPRTSYRVTDFTYKNNFTEEGVQYQITYYIAILTRAPRPPTVNIDSHQIIEINAQQWVSAAEIDFYTMRDSPGHRRILHLARKIITGRRAISRDSGVCECSDS